MNRIRELRKQNKMTQKELAKHLRIADSTLSYWEMEKYEPDNESLKKLSKFFHVTIDYILGVDIEETEPTKGSALYINADNPFHSDTSSYVSETKSTYAADIVDGDTPNELIISLVAFRRSEFEGLTQDEINRLAEYAEFLKSLRKKKEK